MARILGVSKLEILGSLHCLWWWGLDNAPDGFIAEADIELLAQAAEWPGVGLDYAQALIDSGFLDKVAGGYMLHDWPDYAGKLIDRRERNAEQMRRARAAHKSITKEERVKHVFDTSTTRDDTCKATGPNPTGPDQPLSTNVDSGAVARNGVTNAATSADSHEVTASHDAAASAAPAPVSFLDRYIGRLQSEKKNRPGILGAAYAELFGACAHDQYGRIELLAKASGAAETLKAMIKAAAQVESKADDPIAYMAGILKPKNGTGETARLVERFAPAGDGPNALDLYNAREARKKAEREGRADE